MKKYTAKALCFAAALLCSGMLYSAELLKNENLSESSSDGSPAKWNFSVQNDAQAVFQLKPGEGKASSNAIFISSPTAAMPHVYGQIFQKLPFKKDDVYRFSFWAKGEGNGLKFIHGKSWKNRTTVRVVNNEWKQYTFTINPNTDEFESDGTYALRFLCEDVTKGIYISDMELKHLNSIDKVESPKDNLYIVGKKEAKSTMKLPFDAVHSSTLTVPDEKNLSASCSLSYDDKALYINVDVKDDKHYALSSDKMWMGDSIQISIDQGGELTGTRDSNDLEFGFCTVNGKAESYSWDLGRPFNPDEVEYSVTEKKDGYTVKAAMKWAYLKSVDINGKGFFSFNVIVNENDGQDRTVAFLNHGIHKFKSSEFNTVCLLEGKNDAIFIKDNKNVSPENLSGKLYVAGSKLTDGKLEAQIEDKTGKKSVIPITISGKADPKAFYLSDIYLDLTKINPGTVTLSFNSDKEKLCQTNIEIKDVFADATKEYDAVKSEYAELKKKYETLKKDGKNFWRLEAMDKIAERQIALLAEDFKAAGSPEEKYYYGNRASVFIKELTELLAKFSSELKTVDAGDASTMPIYMYRDSKKSLVKGLFECETIDQKGKKSVRPVIFSGYGHFNQVIQDLPYFPSLQNNTIQFEKGPRSVIKGEKPDGTLIVDTKEFSEGVLPALKKAKENNVAVNFLLSPHYFPDWVLKKYPDVAEEGLHGFVKFKYNHPKAMEVEEAFLKAVIPMLKNSEGASAIHSLCMTNEPNSPITLKSEFIKKRFAAYMEKKYGSIAKLNSAWGSNFKSFDEAVPADTPKRTDGAVFYEYHSFRMDDFADWHGWMASIIKGIWPEVKVHAKQMIWDVWSDRLLVTGVDPERLAKYCDLNGNDSCFWYADTMWGVDNSWGLAWLDTSMNFALQSSFKPVQIVNSENHIITDRFTADVPYDAMYTAMFQQFMHGCATSNLWVWDNYNYQKFLNRHDFVGSIYRRPICILAVSDAGVDANRVAYEIRDFLNYESDVALLYSPSSVIMNSEYGASCKKIYAALAFNGRKITFLSEKQLQKGEYRNVKMLVAAGTTHLEPETYKALSAFSQSGGKILKFGKAFSFDAYSKPVKADFAVEEINSSLRGAELTAEAGRVQEKAIGSLPVKVNTERPEGLNGIEWRAIPSKDGTWLVNITNYNKDAVELSFELNSCSCKVTDLVTGEVQGSTIKLNRWSPKVLKLEKKGFISSLLQL